MFLYWFKINHCKKRMRLVFISGHLVQPVEIFVSGPKWTVQKGESGRSSSGIKVDRLLSVLMSSFLPLDRRSFYLSVRPLFDIRTVHFRRTSTFSFLGRPLWPKTVHWSPMIGVISSGETRKCFLWKRKKQRVEPNWLKSDFKSSFCNLMFKQLYNDKIINFEL